MNEFLGKKARKAKSWLKQLSTSSEEMDLTEHDLIYYGLEKRIRKVFILNSDWPKNQVEVRLAHSSLFKVLE